MAGGTFAFGNSGGGTFAFGGASLSPTQAASVQQAQQMAKNPPKSILGDIEATGSGIYHGSTSALGAALGYLMRPSAAVDTALTEAAQHPGQGLGTFGAAAHGLRLGITGKSHDTFSDFIRAAYPKFAAHHKTSTALLGFAGTVVTDPTLPLIVGAQAIPGANVTVDQAEAARLADILGTAATSEGRAAQAKATLDAINKAVGTATSHGFEARKALAQFELERANLETAGKLPSMALDTKAAAASAAAKVEAEQQAQKVLQLKYAIPFSKGKEIPLTPTTLAGVRVAPKLPTLKGVSQAGVPLVSKGAKFLGEAFQHGFSAPSVEKPALVASTKAKQYITDHLFRYARVRMQPHFAKLSQDEMHKALDFGETRNGIVRGSSQGRTLNESILKKAVAHGELSDKQAQFIRDWHDTVEHTRQLEESFGIHHEGSVGNILYVPHRFLRDGGYLTRNPNLKTMFGFAKERQNLTLRELRAAQMGGRFESHNLTLVDNPAEILGRRLEEGGNAMSQHALADVLAHTAGVPKLIPDTERRATALKNVRALMRKQRSLTHIMDTAGTKRSLIAKHGAMVRAETKKVLDRHQPKLDAIDERITHHMEATQTATKHVVPPSKARGMSVKSFRAQVSHMRVPDRTRMSQIHARMVQGKSFEARLAKLKNVKGGPQNAAKKLAADVAAYTGREVVKGTSRGDSWKAAISDALFAERKNLQGEYNDILKKYQSGKAYDHGKAINRLMAQRESTMARAAKEIDAAKFRVKARKGQALEEWQKTFDRQAKQYKGLQAKIEREQRAYGAMKRNPNVPEGWIELDKNLAGGRYLFHPEVHDALTRVERAVNNPGVMQSIANGYRKLLGAWKIGATSANPGYRVRNTASDIWNMYISGVPMPRVVQYGQKAAALQRAAYHAAEKLARGEADLTDNEMQSLRLMAEMQLHGILSGLFQGDIQEVARMFHSGTKARDYLREGKLNPLALGKAYIKATQDWNRHGENWGRITHYLYRRQYQGLSAQKATDWVKKAHFDYEELTPFEQNVMKAIFPFYTWTRKDIPYQLTQMVSRPGKYAQFGHIIQTSNELATGNPHQPDKQQALMPSWMRQNYMFRVPGGEYINPNIGVQDLSSLEHPISQGIGQHLNPLGQVLAAALTGKNPGTGQDIVGTHPRNPVSGIGADILKLIPGSNVGPTQRTVRGQPVEGPGANPWYTFAAQQIPFVNFLVNQNSPIKAAERGGAVNAPLAYLGGISLYQRDLQAEQTAAQLDFQNNMKRILRGKRDVGQLAPAATKKLSPFQISLNNLINQGG